MLHEAKGNGTSMISLILPPKSQISQTTAMLANEYGTASNIKSRVNRQSVLAAITSAQQRLKLYARVPPNGLIVYTGTVLTEDGKVRGWLLRGCSYVYIYAAASLFIYYTYIYKQQHNCRPPTCH